MTLLTRFALLGSLSFSRGLAEERRTVWCCLLLHKGAHGLNLAKLETKSCHRRSLVLEAYKEADKA